jgi:hypothetical protein
MMLERDRKVNWVGVAAGEREREKRKEKKRELCQRILISTLNMIGPPQGASFTGPDAPFPFGIPSICSPLPQPIPVDAV